MAHPAREGTAVYFLAFSMPFSAIVPEIPDSTPREHEQWLSSKLPQGRARHCCRVEAGFQQGCACSATNQVLSQQLRLLILKCQAGHLLLNGTICASKMRCYFFLSPFFFFPHLLPLYILRGLLNQVPGYCRILAWNPLLLGALFKVILSGPLILHNGNFFTKMCYFHPGKSVAGLDCSCF